MELFHIVWQLFFMFVKNGGMQSVFRENCSVKYWRMWVRVFFAKNHKKL